LARRACSTASFKKFRAWICSNLVEKRSERMVVKILSRISVGGISVVSVCRCRRRRRRAVVDGSLDLSARATSFFIWLGHNWRC
jgi:hypothetical protein